MPSLRISIARQQLALHDDAGRLVGRDDVATARNGAGELKGSLQTPRGRHVVCAKFGADAPTGAVFVGRQPTGKVWSPELQQQHPGRDWILSRILWLDGQEQGRNRGGDLDTRARYVYLHGCPDTVPMGVPSSIGCVRMRNADIVELFEQVAVGTPVTITEDWAGND